MNYENTGHDLAFFDEMAGANVLQVVLKAAIYVEHELDELFAAALANPAALRKAALDFHGKAAVAVAIGLAAQFHPPLNALGKIRNNFAHRLDARLGTSEAKSFYDAFSSADRSMIQSNYERLLRSGRGADYPRKFSSLDPIDRFKLCAISLRSAIVAGRLQVQRVHESGAVIASSEALRRI